jgi:pimeloyl-ACP methyl ester carboxylesterase
MPTLRVRDLEMEYFERGEGPCVAVLHPATVGGMEMGWLAQALVRQGFSVIVPDQRGHGQTANPAADMHLSRLVDDFLEFSVAIGKGPLHVVGYSMGGAVALYSALKHPERFRSLTLIATGYRIPPRERINRVIGRPENQTPIVKTVFDPESGITVGWEAPLERFAAITCPTLIVCPDHDEFSDPEEGMALFKTMPQSDLLVLPNCTHFGVVRHPLLMAAVEDFYGRM